MMNFFSVICLLCVSLFQNPAPASVPAGNELPPEWFGRWTGTLMIPNPKNRQEVPLEMTIEPIKGERAYQWVSVYGSGDKKSPRNYKLVPQDKPGAFVIDEGGGILLDCHLTGNVMLCTFKVGDILLTSREELRDGKIYREVATFNLKTPRVVGGPAKESEVHSYVFQSIQYATLTKEKAAAK